MKREPTVANLIETYKKRDRLLIVGFASTSAHEAPVMENDKYDIWGLNGLDRLIPGRYSLMWNLHEGSIPKDLVEHMKQSDIPILMPRVRSDIKKSLAFPFQEVEEAFGSYFSCTVAWQIALAIMMEYKALYIYGVDMTKDSEYAYQRPCTEYYIGIAKGLGIEVHLPETSSLLTMPFVYGKTDTSLEPWVRLERLAQARLQVAERDMMAVVRQHGRLEGAKITLQFFLDAIRENTRVNEIIDRTSSINKVGSPTEVAEALGGNIEELIAGSQGPVPPTGGSCEQTGNEQSAIDAG